jgi:AAA domain
MLGRVHVLITGMSGTGKSAVIKELRRRAYAAYDADDDGYAEPASAGSWRWRVDAIANLLASTDKTPLFFAGCSDEQADFNWDWKVLLTAPERVIITRLLGRSSNTYGKSEQERARVLRDLHEVEPLLRRTADAILDTTQPLEVVVDLLLATMD